MVNWTNEPQPFGPNHAPLLEGLSSVDGVTPVPVAVEPSTGAVLTTGGGGSGGDVNLIEIDGNPVSVDSGNSDSGTQRVILADDQPPIETKEQNMLVPFEYDYIGGSYPDAVTAVYTYKTGGSGGTTVATVTVVYTDSTQENIDTVTRT